MANLDLPLQFMEHLLSTLSPLALKLYLHILLIAQTRQTPFLQPADFQLTAENAFENMRAFKINLQAARTELVLEDLLVDDFINAYSYLIWPQLWLNLRKFKRLWETDLAKLDSTACRALAQSESLLVKGIAAKNLALLQALDSSYILRKSAVVSAENPNQASNLAAISTISTPTVNTNRNDNNSDAAYNELVQSINARFLAGFSSYAWINLIDKLHYEYAFDNVLIYAIFAELQSENKLNRRSLEQHARELYQLGIKDINAYEKWHEAKQKIEARRPFAQKLLRRNLTEAELTLINKWYDEYGYDDEIVAYAFAQSVRSSSPNLNYFDAIVTRWYRENLRSLAEIQVNERDFQAEQQKNRVKLQQENAKQQANKDNFVERQYDAAFFDKLLMNQRGADLYTPMSEPTDKRDTGER